MSELTREHIESVRVLAQHYDGTPVELFGVSVRALCEMALRTHDAEQRAQADEAKNTKLREVLTEARQDTWYAWLREGDNSSQAEVRLAKIDEALAMPPNGVDPLCDECTTEVDCALRDDRSCEFPDESQTRIKKREPKSGQFPSDDFIRGLVYAAKIARRTARELDVKHFDREGASGASDVCDELQQIIARKKRQQNG